MANVQISDLPPATLPLNAAVSFFEIETLEGGIQVSRKVAASDIGAITLAISTLLGRGSAAGSGNAQEITLGANLTMTGTVLSAAGAAGLPAGLQFDLPYISTAPSTYSTTSAVQVNPAGPELSVNRYAADATSVVVSLQKSRNAVAPGQTIVLNNDPLGTLRFSGSDGVAFRQAATIQAAVDGVPGAGDMPGRLVTSTTPDGSITPLERMRISKEGGVTLTLDGATFVVPPGGLLPALFIQGSGTGDVDPAISIARYSADDNSAVLFFYKSANPTVGGNTLVDPTSQLGIVSFRGFDGTTAFPIQGAGIEAHVDGTPGVLDMPGRLEFHTTPDGGFSSLERLRISATGQVAVTGQGTYNLAPNQILGITVPLVIQSTAAPGISIDSYQASTLGGELSFRKSRTAAINGYGVVLIGDQLGALRWYGSTGALFTGPAAEIRADVDANPSAGDMPGRLVFSTTNDGTVVPLERMRITSLAQVAISGSDVAFGTPPTFSTVLPSLVVQTFNRAGIANIIYGGNTFGAALYLAKSRNTVYGGHILVIDNDIIGNIDFRGDDGVSMIPLALIQAEVDGTPGVSDMPGRLIFSTTTNGAGTALERMRISQNGQVVHTGGGNAYVVPATFSGGTQVLDIQNNANTLQTLSTFTAATTGALLGFRKSRSATVGTQTVVQSGDQLGGFICYGSDGTNFVQAASITAEVDGTPGTTDMPGRLVFSISPDGTASPVSVMRLRQSTIRQPLVLSPDSGTNFHTVPMLQFALKASNTNRNTTTTFADDPELVGLILMPSSTYILDASFNISGNGGTVGDFKWNFDFNGQVANVTVFAGQAWSGNIANTVATSFYSDNAQVGATNVASAGVNVLLTLRAIITTNSSYTAGTAMDMQWAQNVSDATNTTLGSGSYYMVTKVA